MENSSRATVRMSRSRFFFIMTSSGYKSPGSATYHPFRGARNGCAANLSDRVVLSELVLDSSDFKGDVIPQVGGILRDRNFHYSGTKSVQATSAT